MFFSKKGGPVNRPIIHGGFNGTSTIMADFQLPCLIAGRYHTQIRKYIDNTWICLTVKPQKHDINRDFRVRFPSKHQKTSRLFLFPTDSPVDSPVDFPSKNPLTPGSTAGSTAQVSQCRWCRTPWRRSSPRPWAWNTSPTPRRCGRHQGDFWFQGWFFHVFCCCKLGFQWI